jgi:uncharacterized iron-regulated protein
MSRLARVACGLLVSGVIALHADMAWSDEDWRTEPWTNWTATGERAHPLAGRIWSVADGSFIEPQALIARLTTKRYVLLGEIHDNPDHHRLQAWIIDRLAASDLEPTVVMEMIDPNRSKALESFLRKHAAAPAKYTAERLGPYLGWENTGWPDWTLYQPIAEAALGAGLPIAAGDVDPYFIRQIRKKGEQALDNEDRRRLGLTPDLDPALMEALNAELLAAHCGLLPESALPQMSLIQRLRDASLADNAISNGVGVGVVLIAGNGHVRSDRGVPVYLLRREPIAQIATVMLIEVVAGQSDPLALIPASPDGKPAADYAWFTPIAEREDPCEAMRKAGHEAP